MTDALLAPINELQALAQTLFQSVSTAQKTAPPPISAFLSIDASLAAATKQARAHQVKQRKIEKLKDEVLELERRWRVITEELEEGRRDLENILAEGEERIKGIEAAKAASIPYPELLAYAQSLSAFTSAPPHMPDLGLPGQPPPPLFFPPFPNEEKMRRGHMGAEEPLGLLGETHEVGKAPSPTKSVELPIPGANPYRPEHRGPQQLQMFDFDLDLNPDL
ncbi:vitamin-D-receptor interacting mediator subunit 4-domain-containing protein [Cristinia sonorae]|uniref:Mediator of RNA polymerase II transcription subunit 4 n=1 Tax=Cristinia sonorae TaxID=1940300 RepID=A0A8K0XJJ6_9AGAR|nr:vitamin-D-receptor interacting mediator subunit 4-domain-containing protein [Cristinia sonorae]